MDTEGPDAADVVVGAGLAGLTAAAEVADAGKRVVRSLGGLLLVDSPEQRRMGIEDSRELAMQDGVGSARSDREADRWPRRWAERGGGRADGHGSSVPRLHFTWGAGPGVVAPLDRRVPRTSTGACSASPSPPAPGRSIPTGCGTASRGIRNGDPVWENHAIGSTRPARTTRGSGTETIIEKEFALAGTEQDPDLTGTDVTLLLARVEAGAPARWRRSSGTATPHPMDGADRRGRAAS